jgi:8-oxo-dGTP pyrophosphatase MutT (NUDIX family)
MPDVVTCILMNDKGEILILKRSDKVGTYRGLWSGVSGYVEEDEVPYETAVKEIGEETGFKEEDFSLIKQMEPVTFVDVYNGKNYNWNIFPFLFKIEKNDKVQIDWEHSGYCWILPREIGKYNTVPCLGEVVLKMFK